MKLNSKNDDSKYAIEVDDLHKSFKLPLEGSSGIKQTLIDLSRGRKSKGYEIQKVLNGVSFKVEKGDFFGIVGRNGSGKSTLLKLLAGIYKQDSGVIKTNGSLVPFIELGVGFNPELTGRENVFLNGALLGFSHSEMESMYDDIVDFAELERFMDQKLKNYSSGMQVRLAFSIAIKAQGDILILDEVLAVGDEAFQRKCEEFFEQIKKDKSKTVILVTHSMGSVRQYCNRAIMLRDGGIAVSGSPDDVANEYSVENLPKEKDDREAEVDIADSQSVYDIKVQLLSARKISQKDKVRIQVTYRIRENIETRVFLNIIDAERHAPLYASSTKPIKPTDDLFVSKTLNIGVEEINNSSLKVALSIRDEEGNILAFPPSDSLPTFLVRRDDYPKGHKGNTPYAVIFDRGEWT